MIRFNKTFEEFYFDFYISTVSSGQKKLGMLGFFSRAKIKDCQARAKRESLVTRVQKASHDDPSGEWLLYFSKSSDIIKQALKLSDSNHQKWLKKNRELGLLYGYPKCCIDFFIRISSNLVLPERTELNYLKRTLTNSSLLFNFSNLVNRFTLNPFVFHVPCSFNCKETIRLTKDYIALAQRINSSVACQILENLKAAVLVTDNSAVSIVTYRLRGGKILFKKEDFKKALLLEERISEYIYKLTSNKKNFDFYISNREMNRIKEDRWKEILARFEVKRGYEMLIGDSQDLKVLVFE